MKRPGRQEVTILRKERGNKVGGGTTNELHKVSVGRMTVAETCIEVEGL